LMTTLCTHCPLESYSQGVADLDQGIDCGIRALGESISFKHENGISDRSHEYTWLAEMMLIVGAQAHDYIKTEVVKLTSEYQAVLFATCQAIVRLQGEALVWRLYGDTQDLRLMQFLQAMFWPKAWWSKSMCQSHATLSICLLLTTSNKQKHNFENASEGNLSNNADLGEMDDVGG